MPRLTVDSPLGQVTLVEEDAAIVALDWTSGGRDHSALLDEAERQLRDYFSGALQVFDLPLRPQGSEFQRQVCASMSAIPFGETLTYGDIAKALSVPAQVVGQACGGNPIPILIPCHRVLAANGLGGFSARGGIESKVWLLRHEGAAGLLI